ncbi:MAG: tetratricopeptide repeat protein [Thermoanaerobaculia bacterium]
MKRRPLACAALALALASPALAGEGDPFASYRAGDFGTAAQEFERRAREAPEDPALRLALGSARYQLGEIEEAVRAWGSLLTTAEPRLREAALYNLGNAAYRQGRLFDAERFFENALELDPKDADAQANLALVRRRLAQRDRAKPPGPSAAEGSSGTTQSPAQGQNGGQAATSPSGGSDRNGAPGQAPTPPPQAGEPSTQESAGKPVSQQAPDSTRGKGGAGEASAEPARVLTRAEAERLLQALEERRPEGRRGRPTRRPASGEDW